MRQTLRLFKAEKKSYDIIILISLCLLCNMHKIIFSCFFADVSCGTPQDVFSTLYSSAYFAGKDWTAIGREYSHYYGYGFMTLFSWLYRITNDGFFIYRFILLCCNLLTVVSCVLCYKIVVFFQISQNKPLIYFLCIACTSVQGTTVISIYNEYALNVCVWVVLYLLIKLCSVNFPRTARIKYTLLLGLFLVYGCMIHARAVVMYILVILCVAIIRIMGKRFIVNIPAMIVGSLLYIPYRFFTDFLQIKLLGEINVNSSVLSRVPNALGGGYSWDKFGTFIMSIITYFHELSVISAGISIVCLASIFLTIFCFFRKKKITNINIEQRDALLCGLVYSIGGIGTMLVGMCFYGYRDIHMGITGQHGNDSFRMLTLVRYFIPFVAPMVLFTILLLIKFNDDKRKEVSLISMVILCVLQVLFLYDVFPKIKHTGWASAVYLPYTWDVEMKPADVYLFGGVIILFYLSVLNIWLIRNGKWKIICVVILLFSIEGILYKYMHFEKQIQQYPVMTYVDGGYSYFCQEDERKDIYVVETEFEERNIVASTYYFFYQMLLPNMRIIPGEPPDDVNGAMILTNDPVSVVNYKKYNVIKLDDNEWLLVGE